MGDLLKAHVDKVVQDITCAVGQAMRAQVQKVDSEMTVLVLKDKDDTERFFAITSIEMGADEVRDFIEGERELQATYATMGGIEDRELDESLRRRPHGSATED